MAIQTLNDNKYVPISENLLIVQSTSLQRTSPMEENMGSVVKVD